MIEFENTQGATERVPHLQILSVSEVWAEGHPKKFLYTHVGSRNHAGWHTPIRRDKIERMIEAVGTKCYNYKCGKNCCNRMLTENRR